MHCSLDSWCLFAISANYVKHHSRNINRNQSTQAYDESQRQTQDDKAGLPFTGGRETQYFVSFITFHNITILIAQYIQEVSAKGRSSKAFYVTLTHTVELVIEVFFFSIQWFIPW